VAMVSEGPDSFPDNIQGDPMAHGGLSALFIDVVGRPLTPGSLAGVHRRHRRRRRRHHEKRSKHHRR